MRSRILFLSIVSFWLVMNYLLWRSQWDGRSEIGNAVPVELVWQRILTAPDNSSLDIYDHDRKIGFCRWVATVGNSPLSSNKLLEQDYAPDNTESKITGYTLSLEGNTAVSFSSNRVRFEAALSLSTNQLWQDFRLRISVRPNSWEIHALAASQKILMKVNEEQGSWSRTFSVSDFQNPEVLLEDLGGSPLWGMVGLTTGSWAGAAQFMQWQAHEDRMRLGHSRVRVYRLETHILGRPSNIFISRVGEILWIELPDQITLRNEALSHL
jgi:hypothetical protein